MEENKINTEIDIPKKKSWISKYSESSRADLWLAIFTFTEASFFPIPPSTLMIAIMASKERYSYWFYYGSLTTIFSVLGGLFGYLIGFLFYDTLGQIIINAYGLVEEVQKVDVLFKDNAFLAIFFAAFTPIPYKVFTLAAGFFRIDPFIFLLASLLGRGLRFYLIAAFVNFLGKHVGQKAMKYLNYFALLIAILAIGYFLYKLLAFAVF